MLFAVATLSVASGARAGFPLVVDDTAVHTPEEFEWVAAVDSARNVDAAIAGVSISLVNGLWRNVDGSVRLGYGWAQDRSDAGLPPGEGAQDVTLGAKALLWPESAGALSAALSANLKLPTASVSSRLGTGYADLGVTAIASGTVGAVSVDANGGYTWTAIERRERRSGDAWFAGTALRWKASEALQLFTEAYAARPAERATPSAVTLRAGLQLELQPGILLGAAAGRTRLPAGGETLLTLGLTLLR